MLACCFFVLAFVQQLVLVLHQHETQAKAAGIHKFMLISGAARVRATGHDWRSVEGKDGRHCISVIEYVNAPEIHDPGRYPSGLPCRIKAVLCGENAYGVETP